MFVYMVSVKEFRLKREIEWIRGGPPVSEPPCGFDGRKCQLPGNYNSMHILN